MRSGYALLAALSLSFTQRARAQIFYLKDQWCGKEFFEGWTWVTEDDPTNGRVNYVSQDEAISKNLTYAEGDKFIMRADDWSIVAPSARGRDSVRIYSQNAYDEAIIVLDLSHMPFGCAAWPAFWTLSQKGPWPAGGEVDVIEGFNLETLNHAALHTLPNCTMPPVGPYRPQTGTAVSNNCDTSVNYNQGCSVQFSESSSFGKEFNLDGGGYYVMLRSRERGIQVWFWSRNSPDVPPEIAQGEGELFCPNSAWGEPAADFPLDQDNCPYDQYFDAHQIIFDLTFCGDSAGANWTVTGCSTDTCDNFVDNNPSAFSEAYWEINSLRVYTPDLS